MKEKSETIIQRYTLISRGVFYSACIAIFLAWLNAQVITFLGLKWRLLEVIGTLLILFMALMLIISWITPGILIVLRSPWLAQAWLRGINPFAISAAPWEQLSNGKKLLIYFWSLLLSGFTLLTIIGLIIQSIRK